MFLICHRILKDHMFKGLCDLMGGNPLIVREKLATFNGQGPCSSRDITYLICHINSCDHFFRELYDIMSGSPS